MEVSRVRVWTETAVLLVSQTTTSSVRFVPGEPFKCESLSCLCTDETGEGVLGVWLSSLWHVSVEYSAPGSQSQVFP